MPNSILKRWLIACLLPLGMIMWFTLNPAGTPIDHLINGIIMACAATFLFKYILFAAIMAHLRGEKNQRNQTLWQFVPVFGFVAYIVWYCLQ
ncbi:hypothetical protein [Wielerella bovis]|uniref:hypothetical protein n=1 Tax=Wielerella bovis TaxID=2917790 RepID=UPI002019BF80|nr:hypothetical protein [Wielerella bovis]ULJ61873.1 hypothetical protein MIS46_07675 [Wielerella bovis]ULJ63999.1 hypothetical protein MIS33_07465 [Wielerella bovis]ULJ68019.1 hypothetical protein MIS31_05670 [Wielerella bovis]